MMCDSSPLQSLQQHGFAILPQLVDRPTLDAMRRESSALLEDAEAHQSHEADISAAEASGCIFQVLPELAQAPANHPARCQPSSYWSLRTSWPYSRAVAAFLQSQNMLHLLQLALSSQSVLLYNEQYIIKPPCSQKSAFAWHYDSYMCTDSHGADYSPYLSLWVALDDMTAENGCLVVLPGSHERCPAASSAANNASSRISGVACPAAAQQPEVKQGAADLDKHACEHHTPAATNSCSTLTQLRLDASSEVVRSDWVQDAMQQPARFVDVSHLENLLQQIDRSGVTQDAPGAKRSTKRCSAINPAGGGFATSCRPMAESQQERHRPAAAVAGYSSDRQPLGLLMPAGTAVLFWDSLLHCSSANSSRYTRTAYMAQFSSRPITWRQTQQPVGLTIALNTAQLMLCDPNHLISEPAGSHIAVVCPY